MVGNLVFTLRKWLRFFVYSVLFTEVKLATRDELVASSGVVPGEAIAGDVDVDMAVVDKLHKNAMGLPGVLYFCLAGSAPISAMLFNVPPIASQAGAASPLVFIISGIGLMLLGVAIVYLSRRLTSAGGFYTWLLFFQAEDGIRDHCVTGVQTCALPIFGGGCHQNFSRRERCESFTVWKRDHSSSREKFWWQPPPTSDGRRCSRRRQPLSPTSE